jgi:hypothetical protein
MRYLIEESIKGKYMIRYYLLEESTDKMLSFIEREGEVDILRVWQSTYMTPINTGEIEDEFGITLKELKDTIGTCLYNEGYETGKWIQADILNIM